MTDLGFGDRLRLDLYEAAGEAGLPLISQERCLQLLAWLYVYGGGQEITTAGGKLTAHLLYAQKQLQAYGTGIPTVKTVDELKKLIKECYQSEQPGWLLELCAEYGIKARKGQEEYR